MKQETNNEMDLLLRRLGRRDEPAAADEHLDADELNAYAENALPAKARARYTAHLAECASCRSLVVELSSSANVVASTDSVAVKEPSGFRKFLASLFTPMVLRYAAPALGLVVVAAIGFVVLRREQRSEYVAQDTNVQQRSGPSPSLQTSEGEVDSYSTNKPSPGRLDERQEKKQTAQAAPAPPNAPPTVSSIDTEVAKEKAEAQPQREEQKAATDAPPPAKPEPTPTPEQSPRAAEPEAAKNEVKVQPAATASKTEKDARGAQRDDDSETQGFPRARRPANSIGGARAGTVGGMQSSDKDLNANISANTRTVAGRRFRKQGSVWTDTAYDSSKDVMTLTRGSEQYRALVADEPAIKTIADQLDGEIIVVWKTRTYRIH
jgi:outer membrane biosynthesis protein TonB